MPHDSIVAINDHVADLVARHPGRLYGLASVDPFDGERAAREAERAIRELGLLGLFVDCARGDLLLDAPQARPTLAVAARLGVPVFAHPVAPQPLTRQMAPYGVIGTLFARGTVSSGCLIAPGAITPPRARRSTGRRRRPWEPATPFQSWHHRRKRGRFLRC